jgi:hypothetical protein
VRPGEAVQISVTATNTGASVVADVYLMATLPPAAGPQLGCPDEDAVVFAVDGGTGLVLACASDPADMFPPYFDNFAIPAGLNVAVPNFLSLVWPPAAPPGPYTIEIFATPAGALANGVLRDEDILGSASDTLMFVP